jgi:hypothetical protein
VTKRDAGALQTDPRTLVLAVIAVGTMVRFLLATRIGLGVDETYAVAVARQWSLSYFDHPPLHFWIAGGVAKLAGSEAGAVVRLPFVLCFIATTWLTFTLGARFFGERAGALGALLLNVSAVFSLSTGGWVLPDGPLMLAQLCAANVLASILFGERPSMPVMRWLVAGACAGLALLSKYHGVFVLGGVFLFLLTSRPHRKWLRHPGPYLGAFVAFLMFTPVLLWNREHGWVSFLFQGGRAAGKGGLHLGAMLTNIGAQAAWVLPWIWLPLAATFIGSVRTGPRDASRWFLLCLAAGPIVVFTLVALRGDVGLPHWQAPGYLFLFPALGAALAARLDRGDVAARRWLRASVGGFAAIVLVLGTHAATGWLGRVAPRAFAKGDPTSDLLDWSELKPSLSASGLLSEGTFVAAPSWIQAGKAAVGLGPEFPVLCLCSDPHHFYYLEDDRRYIGSNAVLVAKVRPNQVDDVLARFGPYFESIEPVGRVAIHRANETALEVGIYRATKFRRLYGTGQPR